MDKIYDHRQVEKRTYDFWEKSGYFKPEVNAKGKPFTIILPPPNANGSLHFGHAMMVLEDILIRFKRMQGHKTLFLPGADHAGFETQFVFEKKLRKRGKSRFDYDKDTLYKMIWDYVQENKSSMENQLRELGFSLDWSREKFMLDENIVAVVNKTFKRMFDERLIYRARGLVNYCTFDGTSFSDLEIEYQERKNPLYYIKYGPLTLATTRPETKVGDTAVAVNPDDKRYKKYVGKEIEIKTVLGVAKIKVIADKMVDSKFGTGVVKITPAHDFNDFEVGKKHNLEIRQVIDYDGKMNEYAGKFKGLYVNQARKAIVKEMERIGILEKVDENYTHRIGLCYKCKRVIEPLPLEQWFVKVKPLSERAIQVVKKRGIKIHPKMFEKQYFHWLDNLRDWNISRQIVWGIRIPAWRCRNCSDPKTQSAKRKTLTQNAKSETSGWIVTDGEVPEKCPECGSKDLEQDSDTFDTWFSSSQWPFATLMTNKKDDFETFYPTSVMETGYDILKAWVSRMVMVGLYVTDKNPFKHVVLHGLVNDPLGKKMSKSRGNVVNPLEIVEKYGADALRFALVYGTALGHDQSLSYSKLDAMRKFTNKLWNMGRFIEMQQNQKPIRQLADKIQSSFQELKKVAKNKKDQEMIEKVEELSKDTTRLLEKYDFNHAAQNLYEFAWHEFADKYIEDVKERIDENSHTILVSLFVSVLKLLHPFMPFVTEELYQKLDNKNSIMIQNWPVRLASERPTRNP